MCAPPRLPACPISLPVVADLPAGSSRNPLLGPRTVARIMTGAAIPDGADAVVPLEHTDRHVSRVAIRRASAVGAHIRRTGEDLRPGDTVLSVGSTLQPRDLAAAASAGRGDLLVSARPRVAVLSTGSELVRPGSALQRGQIPDSNSFLLAASVEQSGGIPLRIGIVPDDEDELRRVLARYADRVDAFLLSGGVSVGAFDVVKAVLAPLGVWFGPVRMQPGKPQGFGRWTNGVPIFALPGNPVSAFVSFEVFVRPALRRLQGSAQLQRPVLRAVAGAGWHSPAGRTQFMPITVSSGDEVNGALTVRPASRGGSGSHLVGSLALADGLAIVAEDTQRVHEGDAVDVMLVG